MLNNDLHKRIKDSYHTFTKAEKKVSDYIDVNPNSALYMSITDVADACGVGDTTVFRFCKSLGLNGFQEFRVLLAQSLSNANTENKLAVIGEIKQDDKLEDVCGKVLSYNIAALNETFQKLEYDKIRDVVNLIKISSKIHFFGIGSSGVSALEANNKFLRILPNVSCSIDSHMQSMSAKLLTNNDLAIVFSYSGSTKDIIEIMKNAKNAGAKTVCITHFKKSPLVRYADIVLLCGPNEGPLQGGSIPSKISQLFMLDIIYNEYFRLNYEICKNNKELTSKAISSMLL